MRMFAIYHKKEKSLLIDPNTKQYLIFSTVLAATTFALKETPLDSIPEDCDLKIIPISWNHKLKVMIG